MRQFTAVIVAVCLLISSCSVAPTIDSSMVDTKPVISLDMEFVITNDPILTYRPVVISQTEVNCLAKGIYYEASSEPYKGKEAVGLVIFNRSLNTKYPKTICGVIKQSVTSMGKKFCQFSWYCSSGEKKLNGTISSQQYRDCEKIATMILNGTLDNWLPNAVSFHATGIRTRWTRQGLAEVARVGNHTFYKERI